MDSGHYRSRGSGGHSGLYFDVRAIRLQCKQCNGFEGGKPQEYKANLIFELGEDEVERLDFLHYTRSYTLKDIVGLGLLFKDEVERMCLQYGIRPWWTVKKGHTV